MHKYSCAALAAILILTLVGCTTNELQSDFALTATLSQSAASVISGLQMDPAVRQELVGSLNALAAAASEGSADLAAGPLTPAEIATLAGKFSASIITTLPNVPPIVLAAVQDAQAVAQIVIGLLQAQQPATAKARTATTAPANLAGFKAALAKYQASVKVLQSQH